MEARPRSMEDKPNLHEDLIWEILLRLPVKSLVRFKCVSKSWLSMISDVNFAKLHYDLTASHTLQLVFSVSIVDSSKAQIQYVDPEGSLEDHSVNLFSPFLSSQQVHDISILGVCRGFILLGLNKWPPENLLVWNPSTGIHRTLSYSEFGSTLRCLPDHPMRASYSLEYDAFTDDYFVVIAWIHRGSRCVERLELFSMRTNSWRQFDAINGFPCSSGWHQPVFSYLHGAIHWLAIDNGSESVKAIIAFDLTERNCSEIPLPDDVVVCDCILRFKVLGGCLCLLCFPRQPPGFAVVWMMKEYKVKSSWTKCNYVPQDASPFPDFYFISPIYFTKAGQIVGYSTLGLAKFNDKGELLHYHLVSLRKYHIYTGSLLSLPTNFGQPQEEDQK